MKKQDKQELKDLLHGAQHDIVQAVRIANSGRTPAPSDIAELMAAWGAISLAVYQPRAITQRIYSQAQRDMLAGLTGAA